MILAGGPRAGKTTLAAELERPFLPIHGSDELMLRQWSEASLIASTWFDVLGPWVCEGVVMPRALRKWLARTGRDQIPAELIVYLDEPVAERSRGQHIMALGCRTVFDEILPELKARGANVLEF